MKNKIKPMHFFFVIKTNAPNQTQNINDTHGSPYEIRQNAKAQPKNQSHHFFGQYQLNHVPYQYRSDHRYPSGRLIYFNSQRQAFLVIYAHFFAVQIWVYHYENMVFHMKKACRILFGLQHTAFTFFTSFLLIKIYLCVP